MHYKNSLLSFAMLGFVVTSFASTTNMVVHLHVTTPNGIGKSVGDVTISETKYGLLFTPNLSNLSPGVHGFHIHEKPSCAENGMAAGGHFDPLKTNKHHGPYHDDGHLGDLPALTVTADGTSKIPLLAPRIKNLSDIKGHALMLHEGGDNYSDVPDKTGGGGTRMSCGVTE